MKNDPSVLLDSHDIFYPLLYIQHDFPAIFPNVLATFLTAVPFNVITGHSQSFSGTIVFIMITVHHSEKIHFCSLHSSQLAS